MFRVAFATALFAGLIASSSAHAAPITYDLTLTHTSGPYGGTGSFTIASAAPASGQVSYSAATLDALTFTIDGQTFNLAGDKGASVTFLNGSLRNISFAEQIGTSPNRYDLQTSSVYAFYYNNELSEASGSITASLAAVPEPGSLGLLAVGLGSIGFAVRRKRG